MTSARSLVAGVAALGFAGALTAPMPVLAASAPCERAASYAAQSGAELLQISRLSVRKAATDEHPVIKPGKAKPSGSAASAAADDATKGFTASASDQSDVSDGSDAGGADVSGASGAAGGVGDLEAKTSRGGQGGGEPADDEATWTDVGLGEAKTALVTDTRTSAAAVARILDGQVSGKASLTEPVTQLAPPTNEKATRRSTPSGRIGPMKVSAGEVNTHARWDGETTCTSTPGEAARSSAALDDVTVLGGLVRVPERISSVSTTALEHRGGEIQTVASATVTGGKIDLAHGQVRIRVLRPATLVTSMSMNSGGEVRYRPATIEVSGSDIKTRRLDTAGDSMEILLSTKNATENTPSTLDGLGSSIGPARPMPMPAIPGLPSVGAPDQESTPAAGSGTKLWISLGDVRQAAKGHARAARATAIRVAITQGEASDGQPTEDRTRPGYAGKKPAVALAMGFGLLEAAAMSPELTDAPIADPVVSGIGGGLPVTGSQAGLLALTGLGLLLAGGAAVFFGKRQDTRF